MKFGFTQFYPEPETDFQLPGPFLRALKEKLNPLNKNINAFSERFKEPFELVSIISAKHGIAAMEIKGPTFRKKAAEAEFVLYLPWKAKNQFVATVEYVLPYISQGISKILLDNGEKADGVDKAVLDLVAEVKINPTQFQYKK